MVFKTPTVFSCLLPARLGFGSNQRHEPFYHSKDEFDPFRGPFDADVRTRPDTVPSDLLAPFTPIDGDIGESPHPVQRSFALPERTKRSSFTTFFAFSSKRKPTVPVIHLQTPHTVPGRWLPGNTDVHLVHHSAIPSPLRTDEEEYYYSYYTPFTHPDTTKRHALRQHDPSGNPDLDSHPSSPTDCHMSHTQFHHPYAYSTPLQSSTHIKPTPSLRHVASQPLRHHPQHSVPPPQLGHHVSRSQPHLSQPQLKTSISTPNLVSPVRTGSVLRKRAGTKSKRTERWLSAETWWDALFSPSPRFKVKPAPRPHAATTGIIRDPVSVPPQGEPSRTTGVAFPSLPAVRPRAVSATTKVKPAVPTLARSRSATDLGQPSTSRAGFEPALATLVDEPASDHVCSRNTDVSSPEPFLSLEQVIDEGNALEQQRAQWKHQASRSIGNRHSRSFSRARSKSLGEKHIHGLAAAEGSKVPFNLEYLAARSLLGSQSTMPVVHITKPSHSSLHSKAYSHSHSQSAYSFTHTSHSRVHSHSHSHSLTTSNSSKSSRNPRTHSRNGSWSRTAFLKAGALCGIAQDDADSVAADEKGPSSSRANVQGTILISADANAEEASDQLKISPPQNIPLDEVGIAISSTPPCGGSLDLGHSPASGVRHQGDQESRWSSRRTHRSSEYAGPHPSAIDSNLPQLAIASTVSLRHRLPPRATIYPPISPIAHPYRSALGQPEKSGTTASEGATLKVIEGHVTEPGSESTPYPHLSLNNPDFERYGVGEALVYATTLPQPEGALETKKADVDSDPSVAAELPHPEQQSHSCETIVLQSEELGVTNTPPSLTNSTIQMVMSAFNNPDDFDEFQDLFYKPLPVSGDQHQESLVANQVPTDVRSSASSSPLTHLVRKLSEEVHSRPNVSRTPSDSLRLQRTESEDHPSSCESGTKYVFLDLIRRSSSPPPMESSSQCHVPIQGEKECIPHPVLVIPEDVNSCYTVSVSGSPLVDRENDLFGYPIKHGHLTAATPPSPIETPNRLSTHLSILEDDVEREATTFLPVITPGDSSAPDAARSSYLTTSDVSRMSGLLDFPLPPSIRPDGESGHTSFSHAYFESTLSESESRSDGQLGDGEGDGDDDGGPSGDVGETLLALRGDRAASFVSHRTTFGGSDDMDFITQVHQAHS